MCAKKFYGVILFVVFLLSTLVACSIPTTPDGDPLYPDNMSRSLASRMREDYVRFLEETNPHDDGWDIDKARVVAYYGNYSGCEIAYMDCFQAYTQAIRSVEVAGYSLTFGNGQELYAYRDSQFYTIQKAYDAGLLTKQDVYNIGTKVGLIIEANNTD